MDLVIHKNTLIPKLFLLSIVFSFGFKFFNSRFGVRVDQIIIFIVTPVIYLYTFLYRKFIFKPPYIFFLLTIASVFCSIYLSSAYSYYNIYQGFIRVSGYAIIGYIIAQNAHFNTIYKFTIQLSFVIAIIAIMQMNRIFNIGTFIQIFYNSDISPHNYFKLPTTTFGLSEYTTCFVTFGFTYFSLAFFKKNRLIKKSIYLLIVLTYLYIFIFSEARGVLIGNLFYLVLLLFWRNKCSFKKISLILSTSLFIISIICIVALYNYLLLHSDILDKSLIVRLERTWAQPLFDWLSNIKSFFWGYSLKEQYADSGFSSMLGSIGIVGTTLFYLPIIYLLFRVASTNSNIFYDSFYFTTIVCMISNVTYPTFLGGRFADIYWLLYGMLIYDLNHRTLPSTINKPMLYKTFPICEDTLKIVNF